MSRWLRISIWDGTLGFRTFAVENCWVSNLRTRSGSIQSSRLSWPAEEQAAPKRRLDLLIGRRTVSSGWQTFGNRCEANRRSGSLRQFRWRNERSKSLKMMPTKWRLLPKSNKIKQNSTNAIHLSVQSVASRAFIILNYPNGSGWLTVRSRTSWSERQIASQMSCTANIELRWSCGGAAVKLFWWSILNWEPIRSQNWKRTWKPTWKRTRQPTWQPSESDRSVRLRVLKQIRIRRNNAAVVASLKISPNYLTHIHTHTHTN